MVIDWIMREAVKAGPTCHPAEDRPDNKCTEQTLKVNKTQQCTGKYIEDDNTFTYLGNVVTDNG